MLLKFVGGPKTSCMEEQFENQHSGCSKGHGARLLGKMLAVQAGRLEIDHQHPCEDLENTRGVHIQFQPWG